MQIRSAGGTCIPVQCDHGVDEDVEKLFSRIKIEQNGQLDVLVNNAYAGVNVSDELLSKYTSCNSCGLVLLGGQHNLALLGNSIIPR